MSDTCACRGLRPDARSHGLSVCYLPAGSIILAGKVVGPMLVARTDGNFVLHPGITWNLRVVHKEGP